MPSKLPPWLKHYLHVPAWVMVRSVHDHRILWVNQRLVDENHRDRKWFVGRVPTDVWPDADRWRHLDDQSAAEQRVVDAIADGKDLGGVFHWLHIRRTPIDSDRLLIVGDDVTARIKLAALRLVLGKGIAGESRIKLDDQFARQLLEGASLEALSTAHGMEHARRHGHIPPSLRVIWPGPRRGLHDLRRQHSYACVKEDSKLSWPLLKIGGTPLLSNKAPSPRSDQPK